MSDESKTKALSDLAAAHVAFREAVSDIAEDRITEPMHGEWSAKDIIAHVACFDEVVALDMRRLARGHVPWMAAFREEDVNEWNAFLMRGRKLFPPAQVYSELETCHEMLVEALETAPQAMFEGGHLATNLLAIDVHHHQDHAGHIRDWREKEDL